MSSNRILVLELFVAMLLTGSTIAQKIMPLEFNTETTSLKHPVQLPPEVLQLLTNDKEDFPKGTPEGLRCSDHEHSPNANEPQEQILCTTLHLSSSPGTDYLIIGVGALRGAHIVPFWIIHRGTEVPVLYFKTRADALTILSSTNNGYRELVATFVYGAGARIRDERYRFNGKSYKLFSS